MSLIPNPLDAVIAVGNLASTIISKIFPNPEDAAKAQVLLQQQDFAPLLEQIRVNLVEAASTSMFVAGWRPFIGWVCGAAFAYKFLLQPFLCFIAVLIWPEFDVKRLPALDWTELAAVLFGMLGLSHNRTQEKISRGN